MSTLSVPLPSELEHFIKEMIQSGYATNKADVVRKALLQLRENEAIRHVFEAERDIKEGRIFSGDIRSIMKKYRTGLK
jgi:putative addiction module CopG family antidote